MIAIECEGISKSFGNTKALENVSCALEEGKIYALLGRNGAGKTTLLNCLCTKYLPDCGEIKILEEKAYEAGKGSVPVQTYGDFCKNIPTQGLGEVTPSICGAYTLGEVRPIFPESIQQSIEDGIRAFGKMIEGFDREDALLSGVESRTSSPVRILRDACGMSEIKGLYPCGEGAGYAGGITSAAMDGIKIAEEIVKTYQSLEN